MDLNELIIVICTSVTSTMTKKKAIGRTILLKHSSNVVLNESDKNNWILTFLVEFNHTY